MARTEGETASRSALHAVLKAGTAGAPGAQVTTIREIPELRLVQVAALPGAWDKTASILTTSLRITVPREPSWVEQAGTRVIWAGPDRWFIAGEAADLKTLRAAVHADAAVVTDLSGARTVIVLSGVAWRRVLAKGTGVDTRLLASQQTVLTSYAQIPVLMTVETEAVRMYVYRSFAIDLWTHVTENALETGYRVDG